MSELVWEVIMTRNGAIKNAFFQTLKDAKKNITTSGTALIGKVKSITGNINHFSFLHAF